MKASSHPDVQNLGLEAIAALPADEAAELTDVVVGWLTSETAQRSAAPHAIIKRLAGSGHAKEAVRITAALFQFTHRDGEVASFFDPTMYEHYLNGSVSALEAANPLLALSEFSDLLIRGLRLDRRLSSIAEEDYSYFMVGSLESGQFDGGDMLSAVIRSIVKFAEAAARTTPSSLRQALAILDGYSPRISSV